MIKANIKFLGFILIIANYLAFSSLIIIFSFFNIENARPFLIKNIALHSKLTLKLLGIKIKISQERNAKIKNALLVCNHMSYLDVLIIASIFPSCFVTSIEMKNTPFLGQLCSLGGCLFVERRSRLGLSDEIKNLTNALKDNLNVVVFPEATSTNGEQVLKFKRPLFQSAIDSNTDILPICINYKKINDIKVTNNNRDLLCWYGDMEFLSHFYSILQKNSVEIELNLLPKITIDTNTTKDDLAYLSHQVISHNFNPLLC